MTKYYYQIPDLRGDERIPLDCDNQYGMVCDVAEAAAEDFYHQRDGWECAWPLVFAVYDEDDTCLGSWVVEMVVNPSFRALVPVAPVAAPGAGGLT